MLQSTSLALGNKKFWKERASAETSIHGIVTNIVRYDIEDEKLAPPKDDLMNHSHSNPAKRHMEGTDCHSPLPKKPKYFLKDEKLNC